MILDFSKLFFKLNIVFFLKKYNQLMNFSSLESLADNELIDQLQQLGDAARQGSV